jgi:hypothetical protein
VDLFYEVVGKEEEMHTADRMGLSMRDVNYIISLLMVLVFQKFIIFLLLVLF